MITIAPKGIAWSWKKTSTVCTKPATTSPSPSIATSPASTTTGRDGRREAGDSDPVSCRVPSEEVSVITSF